MNYLNKFQKAIKFNRIIYSMKYFLRLKVILLKEISLRKS